jgi:hypothetical protein
MSGTLHEDLCTFYCCRSHKFAIKVVLYNTQHFYLVDGGSTLPTERIVACTQPILLINTSPPRLNIYSSFNDPVSISY